MNYICSAILLFGSISATQGITRDHVVHSDANEHEVFLTRNDFDSAENLVEIDLESIGITVPNDPTLTGKNKFEGDIVGYTSQLVRKYVNETRHLQRSAVSNPIRKWPNGEIPYALSSRYGDYSKKVFAKVFQEYSKKTCVKFIPKTSEHRDYIYIVPDDGCYSLVGRIGGRQPVSLDAECIQFGTIIHELMHTTGFFHEQSRTDRDEFVEIVFENIDSDSKDQFEKYTTRTMNSLNLPYDYGSIMHYGPYAFTKNGRKTIRALKSGAEKMGQRDGFSQIDLQKLNKLYDCKQTVPTGDDDDESTTTTTKSGDCDDKKFSCGRWAANGDCTTDRQYMIENCAKTCNFCDQININIERTTIRPWQTSVRYRPTSPTDSNTNCVNKKLRCMLYAGIGFCESDQSYMRENCAKACGFCQPTTTPYSHRRKPTGFTTTVESSTPVTPDSEECENQFEYTCGLWAKQGDCDTRADYMKQKCAKACGFCNSGPGSGKITTTKPQTLFPPQECRDKVRLCRVWAQVGYCKMDKDYMTRTCPKSCGLCGPAVTEDGDDDTVTETTIRPRRYTTTPDTLSSTRSSSQCFDDNPNCPRWADRGFCNRTGFSEFVKKTCGKSCGNCRIRLPKPKLF